MAARNTGRGTLIPDIALVNIRETLSVPFGSCPSSRTRAAEEFPLNQVSNFISRFIRR